MMSGNMSGPDGAGNTVAPGLTLRRRAGMNATEQQAAGRDPFDPPYTAADLPRLDAMHGVIGLYPEWVNSEARKAIEQSAVHGVSDPVVEELLEKGARALAEYDGDSWDYCPEEDREVARQLFAAGLDAAFPGWREGAALNLPSLSSLTPLEDADV